jgi:TonB family protein
MRLLLFMFALIGYLSVGCGPKNTPSPSSADEVTDNQTNSEDFGDNSGSLGECTDGATGSGEQADGEAENASPADLAAGGDAVGHPVEQDQAEPMDPAIVGVLENYTRPGKPGKIFDTVTANLHKIKQCYFDELATHPNLQGTISIQFTVNVNGKVTEAKTIKNELNPKVGKCAIKALRKMKLPKPKFEKSLVYPFQFKPNKH